MWESITSLVPGSLYIWVFSQDGMATFQITEHRRRENLCYALKQNSTFIKRFLHYEILTHTKTQLNCIMLRKVIIKTHCETCNFIWEMLNHVKHKAKYIDHIQNMIDPKLLALEISTDRHTGIEMVVTITRVPKFQVFKHFYSATWKQIHSIIF